MSNFGCRPTDPFIFCSVHDPVVLTHCTEEQIEEYERFRNVAVLKLDELPEQPLKIRCFPIGSFDTKWDKFAGQLDNLDVAWEVFAHHVAAIENGPALEIKFSGDEPRIPKRERGKISIELVQEAAIVIADRASRGGDLPLPHLSPGTWRRERSLLAGRRALDRALSAHTTAQGDTTASDDSSSSATNPVE